VPRAPQELLRAQGGRDRPATGNGPDAHFQICVVDDTQDYRIAVNVMSALEPSTLEFLVDTGTITADPYIDWLVY
jgi:uncharacterized protein YukJ